MRGDAPGDGAAAIAPSAQAHAIRTRCTTACATTRFSVSSMIETTNDSSASPEANPRKFELTADHLAVLAHMDSLEAWRFCRRRRRHVVTPDFGAFMAAVCRMGFAAYCDLISAARVLQRTSTSGCSGGGSDRADGCAPPHARPLTQAAPAAYVSWGRSMIGRYSGPRSATARIMSTLTSSGLLNVATASAVSSPASASSSALLISTTLRAQ